ncbi:MULTISPECIES: alpha/beta hydrolase [unclassified Mesorhizobium]|uniref:alpha/beta fold hydrolase n=1 Tax=unclassified Mesorhizobium TaxID=325217 RepID=UPI000FEA9AE7|nr:MULTISPECIES: alpha/beta hydrolase [unclassified Mesorhizobium]RWB33507.1 MAG: alpha/beta hydrolase [Mesorhizobium sp.]RWB50901.1 MAG: alpha/beta hydrolase [Mesorhizobium sp.]RWC15116.1 MAG: alpha/beta hydrolase [Mesorhizobium sp.]RWC29364.1 MAG: alpha/beta hydrolase [Mesorhizobium sp.]RWD22029.1 MAG: alpha/beta hydrolase [Mesorhizobium sp.]
MMKAAEPEIASETFGDPAHPPMLLIMGAMASMLWWPEAFCRKLAGKGLFVIRYDNRDTGRSTKYAPGEPPYTFDDMADDAIRVLDSYGIAKAHVAGMSMGGMIAQLVALKHPSRIISLTAISTSPIGIDTSHLPGTTDAYMKHSAEGAKVDWSNRDEVVDFIVKDAHAIAGTAHPFDEKLTRAFVEQDYDRSGGLLSATNHFLLKSGEDRGGEDWRGRLHELKVPLLVIHGTADPIFPVEHGAALAEAVAGASLVRIEGGGHELHPDDWATIVDAIVTHSQAR